MSEVQKQNSSSAPDYITCNHCGCRLNKRNVNRHRKRCIVTRKRGAKGHTRGSTKERVNVLISSAPAVVFEESDTTYARPYVVSPDGTVVVVGRSRQVKAGEAARPILHCESPVKGSDSGRGDDLRDAARYAGHSFRDQKGGFGSYPVHDAHDDESTAD